MQHANNYRNSPENVRIQNRDEIESSQHPFFRCIFANRANSKFALA
ncbi:hypothetical protein F993_00990 [Acinetobacter proteolyticus]|uniref:Uncharacterized protein n=1 Tax=Acinetobacter proteolyticus TaxID=1776741 RepID=A0ABN0JHR6_9GAMM|nr:hypothetical protein F993_00990 [Acinetobacter proteolyticus]